MTDEIAFEMDRSKLPEVWWVTVSMQMRQTNGCHTVTLHFLLWTWPA